MTVHVGDCRETMRAMPPESVDAIVTDPPYGLSFMGKGWDRGVPGVEFWTEALRVAKPGAYLLAFGGTRTFHRLTCAIEDAGFGVQDCLSWLYGSGFPKHKSKLKPAWEPIILARKPAPKATPLNIDACRIPTTDPIVERSGAMEVVSGIHEGYVRPNRSAYTHKPVERSGPADSAGRWPANVVLDEEAARALDEQSGELTSNSRPGAVRRTKPHASGSMAGSLGGDGDLGAFYGDSGGASRFYYCAKASRSERGEGNSHPTVKPIALMRWLVRLVTPPDGLVLDPFTGSGTTGCAAVLEGRRFVGCELSEEYAAIARARIAHWTPVQPELGVA